MYPRIPWELVKANDCVEAVLGKDSCLEDVLVKGAEQIY